MNIEFEEWKPYKDSKYEVSCFGNVRRIDNKQSANLKHDRKYLIFTHKGRNIRVHRAVIECFKGVSALDVHHIDGNEKNNTLSNLEYVSPSKHIKNRIDDNILTHMPKPATLRKYYPDSMLSERRLVELAEWVRKYRGKNHISPDNHILAAIIAWEGEN